MTLKARSVTAHPPSAPRPASRATDEVWYFAYGANTSRAVLTGRRKIAPRSSEAACLNEHRLAFAMPGVPFLEPAFATVLPEPGARTEGVLHRMRESDMRRLDGYESRAYARLELPVLGSESGPVRAQVYVSKHPRAGLVPSRRYVELLIAGAKEHGLSAEHVAWLEAHPAVDSRLGRLAMGRLAPVLRFLFG